MPLNVLGGLVCSCIFRYSIRGYIPPPLINIDLNSKVLVVSLSQSSHSLKNIFSNSLSGSKQKRKQVFVHVTEPTLTNVNTYLQNLSSVGLLPMSSDTHNFFPQVKNKIYCNSFNLPPMPKSSNVPIDLLYIAYLCDVFFIHGPRFLRLLHE